jgi:two-component system, OmpR family, sensor histidine kinase MtrB
MCQRSEVLAIASNVVDASPAAPRRFRRRLTAAFVLVAAVCAGLVAVVTVVLAWEYRWDAIRSTSLREAQFALAVAPAELDGNSFERFRRVYEQRSDADIVAVDGPTIFSSSPNLDVGDLPIEGSGLTDEPVLVESEVDGREMLVAAVTGRDGVHYYLFFSLDQLHGSLDELVRAAAISWTVTVVVAAAAGWLIARRTLKPVAAAASAAEAIAAGDLAARLIGEGGDEFGTLATSFNHMADEVQELIGRLAAAAERERRFTADVAHELRTPLTGLAAAAALLGDQLDTLPPSSRRAAAIVVADVERLRDLVLELLELARLDAATEAPALVPLRVRAAVDAVVAGAHLRRTANVAVDAEPDVSVLSDPVRLRRTLANLLDNAIVHGGGTVQVIVTPHGDEVSVDVIDDGPGIAAHERDRVFDRFFKADRSRATGGSGLGLAIAREYARSQGGSLTVRNDTDHGTRFTLTLPAAPPDQADATAP